jgi:predicted nucleic acid binding AN1-type Zn finger protein
MIRMRCQHTDCKKKITLIQTHTNECRCKKVFCDQHRLPETHICDVDHKAEGRIILQKTLIEVKADKIIMI